MIKFRAYAGPRPTQSSFLPLQVLWLKSHGSPESRQNAPRTFGELSPSLLWQNAATKGGSRGLVNTLRTRCMILAILVVGIPPDGAILRAML